MSAESEHFAQAINEELENILEGRLWRSVDNGDEIVAEEAEMRARFGDNYEYDYEPVGIWDFMGNCYDRRYIVEGDCSTYRSVMLMLAGGGPTAWLNTENGMIEFSWGGSPTEYHSVYPGACDEIDECARELWNSRG